MIGTCTSTVYILSVYMVLVHTWSVPGCYILFNSLPGERGQARAFSCPCFTVVFIQTYPCQLLDANANANAIPNLSSLPKLFSPFPSTIRLLQLFLLFLLSSSSTLSRSLSLSFPPHHTFITKPSSSSSPASAFLRYYY
ncbi:hypothetical protein BU24DRAFT_246124 [Aaosphaeria arxii CBS 175.79]|uniref:Uncharacterized protein n=1 Tax=Aaosphaeria arxii CBS 175.79 TaxID=1450172 RepID=A0A6A5XLQ9_9PLEO|nr:uncharacterized protein BU24DRAFT_246124 [Aaosphaeria arxii CBS 175.79]KAF2013757.1 hypothetical protein BU24DRAFT_246124 [Aaosphaeria arxii CBS 175.79]